ncbi:hypothetical protein pgond44_14743 [Psychroflexus gondwanensis ACAM 44]|jgi:hypothetical protein|uniref:Secreted protein n=1 Tax=Psychroflexus gondwanensis ACAM 44 TaxID=1189619 RepID=N1WHX6_9FLAO|nr:hypothetical protein [Psychroflexus gondwanensis]EMY79876.1 hypothetical protein pgond44_14743 [Psychroflexus gondwanensis ACAM 44]
MKTKLTLITLLFLSFNIYAQEFSSKPFTVAQNWMEKSLSQSDIKKAVPSDYELVSEDTKMLIFEKTLSSRIYDIKVLYDNGKISSVIFSMHSDKVWNFMGEIDELKYKNMDNGFKRGAIESESYNNSSKPFIIVWVTNDNKRTATGFVNRK